MPGLSNMDQTKLNILSKLFQSKFNKQVNEQELINVAIDNFIYTLTPESDRLGLNNLLDMRYVVYGDEILLRQLGIEIDKVKSMIDNFSSLSNSDPYYTLKDCYNEYSFLEFKISDKILSNSDILAELIRIQTKVSHTQTLLEDLRKSSIGSTLLNLTEDVHSVYEIWQMGDTDTPFKKIRLGRELGYSPLEAFHKYLDSLTHKESMKFSIYYTTGKLAKEGFPIDIVKSNDGK